MTPIEVAILRTVLYADVFAFPMTAREIQHYLIASSPVELDRIEQTLTSSAALRGILIHEQGYILLDGRQSIIGIRQAREAASVRLWESALTYGAWLARLPFVRMVALTGALAMRNAADGDDDLDYVIVTQAGRVWLARGFAVLLVRLARLRGVTICPNYVLAETALEQEPHTLFMAHEVAQMVPIYGRQVYRAMRDRNPWVLAQLPNTLNPFYNETELAPQGAWALLKQALESVLNTRLGGALERWEHRRKARRFAEALQTPHSAARLDEDHVKGHFNDHGHPVLRGYDERLRRYHLSEDAALPLAGD